MRVGCVALAGVHHRGRGAHSSNCYITDFPIQTGRRLWGQHAALLVEAAQLLDVGNPPLPNENSLQDGDSGTRELTAKHDDGCFGKLVESSRATCCYDRFRRRPVWVGVPAQAAPASGALVITVSLSRAGARHRISRHSIGIRMPLIFGCAEDDSVDCP